MTEPLGAYGPHLYRGLSYEEASRRARRVCQIAGVTGQTHLALKHLTDLVGVMGQHQPDAEPDAAREPRVGSGLAPCHWLPLAPGRFVDAVVAGTDGRNYLALPWDSPVEHQVKSLIASRLARPYRRDDVLKAIQRLQAYAETLPSPSDSEGEGSRGE